MEANNPQTTNELNFQRSAIAPVGIVAVASMKTSWKKKKPITDTSYACPVRKKPDLARMFQSPRCIGSPSRSEEHTSELQSRENLVCRLLLEKKKQKKNTQN